MRRRAAATAVLDYDFMRHAFAAGGLVALMAGPVGYFLVLRGQSFAGHALSHVGFAGATGAILAGLPPLWGLLAVTVAAGGAMGALGERLSQRDVAIGVVLALSLGFGMLFMHFFTTQATQASTLLFGNVLGVDAATVRVLAALAVVVLASLAAISRPLLFASLQPDLAEARGVKLRRVGAVFLMLAGAVTAGCAQVVGVLLVFTLMVAPAATAQRITPRVLPGIVLSAILALASTWAGISLAWISDWPTSFWIVAVSSGAYLLSGLL